MRGAGWHEYSNASPGASDYLPMQLELMCGIQGWLRLAQPDNRQFCDFNNTYTAPVPPSPWRAEQKASTPSC